VIKGDRATECAKTGENKNKARHAAQVKQSETQMREDEVLTGDCGSGMPAVTK